MKETFGKSSETPVRFAKLHSNGNTFLVVDNSLKEFDISDDFIRRISDPNRGVRFDQLLVLKPPSVDYVDYNVVIFNRDGTTTNQCVNGIRCVAHYVFLVKNLTRNFVVLKLPKQINRIYKDGNFLKTQLERPVFDNHLIPIISPVNANTFLLSADTLVPISSLQPVSGTEFLDFYTLSVGNPHAISLVDEFDDEIFYHWGTFLQNCRFFPEKVNFSMVKILDKNRIMVRTYERGVGETESCGSASVSSVIAMHKLGLVERNCDVLNLKKEIIKISIDESITASGRAHLIFLGTTTTEVDIKNVSSLETYSQDDSQDA